MLTNTSVVIVTYNHKNYLQKCLDSIPAKVEVIVIDNSSNDGTPEFIEEKYPQVKLIKSKKNLGYGKGVNLGVKNSNNDYIVILNPDTIVQDNSFEELIKPLIDDENIITVPKVLLYDGSGINTCGNIEHFTGLTFTRDLREVKEYHDEIIYLSGLSGVCFAIKKDLYNEIGGFDENIFLYMEDTELSWKINSKGYKIQYVPNSIFRHDYKLNVPAEKIYHLERGRYIILRKYFSWKQFLMFLPSIFITELFTFGYASFKGFNGIKFKLKAVNEGLNTDIEKVDIDRKELIQLLDWKIPNSQLSYHLLDKILTKIGNLVYFLNYNLILYFWTMKALNINKSEIADTEIINELPEKFSK